MLVSNHREYARDPIDGSLQPEILWGTGAPDGDAEPWIHAAQNTLYFRQASGNYKIYRKTAADNADADWEVQFPVTVNTGFLQIQLADLHRVTSNAITSRVGTSSVTRQLMHDLSTVKIVANNDATVFPYNNRRVTQPVLIGGAREIASDDIQNLAAHGGDMAKDSTPIFERVATTTDKAHRLRWAATVVDEVDFETVLPDDLDETQDILIKFNANMSDVNNTVVISADTFFDKGDTKVEDDSAAVTGTSVAEYTITIAAADVPDGATQMTFSLTPAAHANDALNIHDVRVEYFVTSKPRLEYVNGDTDSQQRLAWPAGNAAPIALHFMLPDDYDDTQDITFKVYGDMSGSNDTPTLGLESYFDIGDTKVADTVSALGSSPAVDTATIAAADIPAGARNLTIELTPGAHATDELYIYGLWLDYKVVSAPSLAVANGDTDAVANLTWLAGDTTQVWWSGALPPDFDGGEAVTVHFRGKMSSTNDTPTVTVDSWWDEGDTKVSDTSSALGSSFAEETATIAAADIPDTPQVLTLKLTPGSHATDNMVLSSLWVEYTRLAA